MAKSASQSNTDEDGVVAGTLVAITYPDEQRAADVLATLKQLRDAGQIALDDAAILVKDRAGKFSVREGSHLTAGTAMGVGFLGLFLGVCFAVPIVGLALGAAGGALIGKRLDANAEDRLVREMGEQMEPGSAALIVCVRDVHADVVVAKVRPFGGTVLKTSLAPDAEARLRQALAQDAAARPSPQGENVSAS